MYEEDIKNGLEYYGISADEIAYKALKEYLLELKRWNEHINLTGIKDISNIITTLLYDAFFVYSLLNAEKSILDLGSGAGIISVPIAILKNDIDVFSVDKNIKKIHFQRHIKRKLMLNRFYPLHGNIESLNNICVELVVVKALGSVDFILKHATKILKDKGRILILKGKGQNPINLNGAVLVRDVIYTLPYSEKTYRFFEYVKA